MIWLSLGVASFAVGVIGVVLPLVPTTAPMLLAAWCFARSSPRLEAWLVDHPRLGPPIRDWRAHGAISRRAKWIASAAIAAAPAAAWAAGAPDGVLAIQIAVLAGVTAFIWTRPEGRREAPAE